MKKLTVLLMMCGVMVGLMYADGDVTAPGDPVIGQPNNNRWPGGEAPQYAIDNDPGTKYLHFRDREESGEVGIIVTPATAGTIVQGIALTSANDAAGRDPIDFELYGSNGAADVGPWTLIATGPVPDFMGNEWPRQTPTETPMIFPNEDTYNHYRLMFPTMRGGINELFQIAEIELLEKPTNGWAAGVSVVPETTLLLLPEDSIDFDATIDDFDSSSWTISWTQVSGPAAVNFNGTENDEDASVTFPAVKGNYVLQIDVTDDTGNVSNPKRVLVRVWDAAIDEQLISHWPLDETNGVTEIADLAGDFDRGYLGNYAGTHSDPNFVTGWVTLPGDAAVGNAGDFFDAGFIEVYPDPNSVGDPNMLNLDAGVTVTSWVYANDWNGNRRVLQFGNPLNNDNDNIFRMLHEWGELKFDTAPGRVVTASIFPSGEWHHMAGTYDGMNLKLYVDGVEVASQTYDSYAPMRTYNGSQVLTIGAKSREVNYEEYPGDYMSGMLDDIRVYSYAADQSTIRSLVELGQNSAPAIEDIIAEDAILTNSIVTVDVDAVVYDAHGDALNYKWDQQSPATPEAVFSATDVEDPQVTFSEAGTYVLRLTVDDGVYGLLGTIYRDVTIVVSDANCDKVKLDGLLMSADLNEDCYINLDDLALMALDWLACNDPENGDCDNPYAH